MMPFKQLNRALKRRKAAYKRHVYALPQRGYRARLARIPWGVRLAVLLGLFAAAGSLGWMPAHFIASTGLLWAALVFPDHLFIAQEQTDKVRNMPAMLHIEMRQGTRVLRVGMEEAPIAKLGRIAVGQRDDNWAYLHFIDTHRIVSPLLFPVEQIPSVRQWLAEHVPEILQVE